MGGNGSGGGGGGGGRSDGDAQAVDVDVVKFFTFAKPLITTTAVSMPRFSQAKCKDDDDRSLSVISP